jgi:hypothetical protein
MSKLAFIYVLGLCCVLPPQLHAQNPPVAHDWTAEVDLRIKVLGSSSAEDRLAATDWLFNSEPDALASIEAAAVKAGTAGPVAGQLKALLVKLRPLAKVRAAAEAERQNDLVWNAKSALEAYEHFGNKNPQWDDEAKKAIGQFVSLDINERKACTATLERLITELHCDDPLILYFKARRLQVEGSKDVTAIAGLFQAACEGFKASKYSAFRKCFAYIAFSRFMRTVSSGNAQQDAMAEPFMNESLVLWPQAINEPAMTRRFASDMAVLMLDDQTKGGKDRGQVVDQMLPSFEKAFPPGDLALVFAGDAYVDYAWDARGLGYGNTVTPEGWKLMGERLQIAEKLLTTAYDRNPSDPAAATRMLQVVLGQKKGKEVMEMWFKRAIAANPIHTAERGNGPWDAYLGKLEFLQPKWYGSEKECLAFGRECVATRNYRDRITWVLIEELQNLAEASGDAKAFWRSPAVWADVRSVLLPMVKADPANVTFRNRYARWAHYCGQWKIADEQFKLLGNRVDLSVWGNQEAYDAARAEAAGKAR